MFDQFQFRFFIIIEAEFEERRGCPTKTFYPYQMPNHIKLRLKSLWVLKVNMTLNLNILLMLNVLGVKGKHLLYAVLYRKQGV